MNHRSTTDRVVTSVGRARKPSPDVHPTPQGGGKGLFVLLLIALVIFGLNGLQNEEEKLPPGLERDADGKIVLAPGRRAKLDRELEEIDKAVQYALIAITDGLYPCYSCPGGQKTIYLYKGNVWKYGVTRKGEFGRYPRGNYGAADLFFQRQFRGTYSECLKQEKTRIYNYPFLPETKKLEVVLIRPPGNAYDS